MLSLREVESNHKEMPEHHRALCKGRIFKGQVNVHMNGKNELNFKIKLVPQIRLSCPGCDVCSWINGALRDEIASDVLNVSDVINVQDGHLYRVGEKSIGGEDFDFIFNEVDPKDLIEIENLSKKEEGNHSCFKPKMDLVETWKLAVESASEDDVFDKGDESD